MKAVVPCGSFMGGARGIWQDVFLEYRPSVFIEDAHIKTSTRKEEIDITVRLNNQGAPLKNLSATIEILDGGKIVKTWTNDQIPFIVADLGNILGGLLTQFIIKKGVAVPKVRKIAAGIFGSTMAFSLIFGPLMIYGPFAALVVIAIAGFGYAAYSANTLAFPADVVPLSATASVWGLASIGSNLDGAIFQSISGFAVKKTLVSV